MDLVIGGAYQGKLLLAKNKFSFDDIDVFNCSCINNGNSENVKCIDFGKKCIYHVEQFSLYCVRNDIEAKDYFAQHKKEWENSIIICEDIFCGVVPIDDELRAWREMTGRLSIYLTSQAESVTRVFCGLEQVLK